jgi:hypothetical protein
MDKQTKRKKMSVSALHGGLVGFGLFVLSLEGPGMGNILYRNGQWYPSNIVNFLVSPFYQSWLWRPELWTSNWLIMTSVGALLGTCFL